jgi:hypothetical protein
MKDYLLESGFTISQNESVLVKRLTVSKDTMLWFYLEFDTELSSLTIYKFCGNYDLTTATAQVNTIEELENFIVETIKSMKPYLTYAEYLQAHEEELKYDLTFTKDRLWLTSIGF